MSRVRRSKAEWAGICREYAGSRETAAEFSRRRGLNPSTLLWWMSRLRPHPAPLAPPGGFVEVVQAEPEPRSVAAVVRVGAGPLTG